MLLFIQVYLFFHILACFLQCLQSKLFKECSCYDQDYFSIFSNKNDCLNETEHNCSKRVWENFDWKSCLEYCPLECNQTQYSIEVTSVKLLGEKYAYLIRENTNLSLDFVENEVSAEAAANSFISLSIFYDTLSYTLITESPKLDAIALLANLGGNLSLFLGISIFSFSEIIEIII